MSEQPAGHLTDAGRILENGSLEVAKLHRRSHDTESTNTPPPKPHLLSIPKETRNQIFGYVTEDIANEWRTLILDTSMDQHIPHPLKFTCRQINKEFGKICDAITLTKVDRLSMVCNNLCLEMVGDALDQIGADCGEERYLSSTPILCLHLKLRLSPMSKEEVEDISATIVGDVRVNFMLPMLQTTCDAYFDTEDEDEECKFKHWAEFDPVWGFATDPRPRSSDSLLAGLYMPDQRTLEGVADSLYWAVQAKVQG